MSYSKEFWKSQLPGHQFIRIKALPQKCLLRQAGFHFLGHCINKYGLQIHTQVNAITFFLESLPDVEKLKCMLSIINYLGYFLNELAVHAKSLNDLLFKDSV